MGKKIVSICLLVFSYFILFAAGEKTILTGNAPEYKNTIIEVYTYSDYITRTLEIIAADTVGPTGDFSIEFVLDQTKLILLPLGTFQALMYAEPGKTYDIVLPGFHPKTMGDRLNPYYEPTEIYLGVKNPGSNELNVDIQQFDQIYHEYVDENYYVIFRNAHQSDVDTVIQNIEKLFDTIPNSYFYNYRKYKYAWLKFISYMRDNRYITRDYYHNQPFLYFNPAYMDLFNQLFADYFSFYATTSEGERLFTDVVYAKSPDAIKQTFSNNLVLVNDTLQELVMLKGLHDACYSPDYPLASLLITLDSVELLTKIPYHKTIAENIRKKVLQAREGYPAPWFSLTDTAGHLVKLTDFKGKYVYLNFCSVQSYSCQQDFELLKELYNKHKNDFSIVSISIDDDFAEAQTYFSNHDYQWELLSYKNQPSVCDAYKIKAYPTYFLINPEGKLSMSPAALPAENFEWRFFLLLQNSKHKPNE